MNWSDFKEIEMKKHLNVYHKINAWFLFIQRLYTRIAFGKASAAKLQKKRWYQLHLHSN